MRLLPSYSSIPKRPIELVSYAVNCLYAHKLMFHRVFDSDALAQVALIEMDERYIDRSKSLNEILDEGKITEEEKKSLDLLTEIYNGDSHKAVLILDPDHDFYGHSSFNDDLRSWDEKHKRLAVDSKSRCAFWYSLAILLEDIYQEN